MHSSLRHASARITLSAASRIKRLARLLLPPIIPMVRSRLSKAEWEYVGENWPKGDARSAGWDDPSVASVMVAHWDAFLRKSAGSGPIAYWPWNANLRGQVPHNVHMTYAYVLSRIAVEGQRISVLDWGGALGHQAVIAKALFPETVFDYTVKERPALCESGRRLLPHVTFTSSEDDCFSRHYDLVMASGSLQYAEDWRGMMARLAGAAKKYVFIANLPIVNRTKGFVVVQRPQRYALKADFVSWVLNRGEFLSHAQILGLTLQREFISWGTTRHRKAPENPEAMSFLFLPGADSHRL